MSLSSATDFFSIKLEELLQLLLKLIHVLYVQHPVIHVLHNVQLGGNPRVTIRHYVP